MQKLLRIMVVWIFLAAGQSLAAAPLQLNLTDLLRHSAPSAPMPWITATFEDVSAGVVRLTVSTSGLSPSVSLKQFLFNFDGRARKLGFDHVAGEEARHIKAGDDRFNVSGGGKYDLRLTYDTRRRADQFTGQETSVYEISGRGISTDSFALKSDARGNRPTFYAAAEVILANGKHAWIGAPIAVAVPEPEAYAMMLAGLGVLGFVALRRRQDFHGDRNNA